MGFDLEGFKAKLGEQSNTPKIEVLDPESRKKELIGKVAAQIQHRKTVTITPEMQELGVLGIIQQMIHEADMRARLTDLCNRGDEDYDSPFGDDAPKFSDCL